MWATEAPITIYRIWFLRPIGTRFLQFFSPFVKIPILFSTKNSPHKKVGWHVQTNSRVIGYPFKRPSAATKFFVCGYLACDSVFGFLFSSLWWFCCDLIILFTIITRTATTSSAITNKYYKLYWQLVMQFYVWNFSLPIFSFLFQLEDMVDSFWWSLFVTVVVVAVAVGRLSLFLSKKKNTKQNTKYYDNPYIIY